MPIKSSIHTFRKGHFRSVYRLLKSRKILAKTPIIMCEGDSWFSTPLATNLLDHLVQPTPEEEAEGQVWLGGGGLFFRAEKSGDTAINMFSQKNTEKLLKWFKSFEFDLVLLSAGGNDFVADFLENLFKGKKPMSVDDAMKIVIDSGRYEQVKGAFAVMIQGLINKRPEITIIAHTYDYPVRLGVPAELTLNNVGLVALFKKEVGDWIGDNIDNALPAIADKIQFARLMIDEFEARVLKPLSEIFEDNFSYVDLRGTLIEDQWYDEMHPTSEGFKVLAEKFKQPILNALPALKKS